MARLKPCPDTPLEFQPASRLPISGFLSKHARRDGGATQAAKRTIIITLHSARLLGNLRAKSLNFAGAAEKRLPFLRGRRRGEPTYYK